MIRSILAAALLVTCANAAPAPAELARADELFAGRDDVEKLKQGAALLVGLPSADYEILWRLARFRYYLGDRERVTEEQLRWFEAGMEAGKAAVLQAPQRVEGHFWLGANIGEHADRKGALTGLTSIRKIRSAFETVRQIDPGYENSSVYVALGELDLRLPRLLGGSTKRGLAAFEQGLATAPDNLELRIRLARYYIKKGRSVEARKLLETALTLQDPLRTPAEVERLRSQAREMLRTGGGS